MGKRINTLAAAFMILFLQSCLTGPATEADRINALLLPDINTLFEGYDQLDSTAAFAAFANNLVVANRDLKSSQLYVEAASLYHLAGNNDSVIRLFHMAIDQGMSDPNVLSRMNISRNDELPAWKDLYERLDSIRLELGNVDHFSIETEAMSQFWPYFERAKNDSSQARVIFKEFIFKGPRELRDFYVVRYYNTDAMYGQMINASPKYYTYLRDHFDAGRVQELKKITINWMKKFKEIYPQAVFPKVYVVPGILNSGGTATEMGLFVGGDMYGKSDKVPTEELTDWQRDAIMELSSLPSLTLHELMHFQQNYGDPENTTNVLFNLVQEGVCDFLVELSSGETLANSNLDYLKDDKRRRKILNELRRELKSEDLSKWLYNGGSIQDRPHDLGYTLGYLITKSYYEHQHNKKAAVYELLNSKDLTAIVRGSEYAFLLEEEL